MSGGGAEALYYESNYDAYSDGANDAIDRDRWYTVETEGIYVGYRYYETRYFDATWGRAMPTALLGWPST